MLVWDGEYHEIGVCVLDRDDPAGTRWQVQCRVQRAASFGANRRLTDAAACRRRWHRFPVGQRRLARRFMIEIEPLVVAKLVTVELDGERVRIRRRSKSSPKGT